MKKFLKGVVEWKLSACAIFTAAVFFYLLICLFFGARQVSTSTLWGLFWASVAGSLFQAVCFSDWIIKKLRYTWRSLLFVAEPVADFLAVVTTASMFAVQFKRSMAELEEG